MKNKKKGDVIDTLFTIVEERKKTKKKGSYTSFLFNKGNQERPWNLTIFFPLFSSGARFAESSKLMRFFKGPFVFES